MARAQDRLAENVPGEFFVTSACIDCDACRQLAPTVFGQSSSDLSYVCHQPESEPERQRALMALVACPTSAIGTPRKDIASGVRAFPEEIEEGVFYCGFTAESSFGAASYLIRRPQGNVLCDSPRAARPLMRRIAALGGVACLFLTHEDDIADQEQYAARFGCARVMHERDIGRGTAAIERPLSGKAPIRLADDLLAIPVPGHTAGSMALLYRDRFLFSGDHLWWSDDGGRLSASRSLSWSWAEQIRSTERLLEHRFEWILPGHGRRYHAPSAEAMRAELRRLVDWMHTRR